MTIKEKGRRTLYHLLPVAALVFIAAFLILCRSRFRTEFPVLHPQDGILDARDVDLGGDVYHLVNEWDYYPGWLLDPDDFRDLAAAAGKDNDSPLDPVKGTWRLRILAQPETYLSICSFSIDYSTRVFVNGKEERNIGFVSDDPDKAAPKVRYMILPLYTGQNGEIEIVCQYANYIHNEGGFIQNTLISTPENIDEYLRGVTLYSLFISSGLVFLLFYFLLCAAFQRSREYGALALCCLVIAFRNQFFFAEHLLEPGYDFLMEYRVVVLDVSWIPASAIFLICAFFPRAVGKKSVHLFAGMFFLLSVLHFTVNTSALVALCHICYYSCIPFLIYITLRLFRYFHREQRPAREDVLILAAIALFTVMLIWEGLMTGRDSTVNHFGITPLAMIICILILAIVINGRIQRQTTELRDTRQRNALLGQINSMNRDFLRTVAHELKTPLTVISGYAQLMERQMERGGLSEKTPERLQTICSEADRLGEMVSRLMDYTYGMSSDTEMGSVDPGDLLRAASAVMEPVCARRQNRLTVHNDCRSRIHGNHELLLQVLINLIVNASRHTQAGSIDVTAVETELFAVFTVSDTGMGIAPDAVPHIFEKGFTTGEGRGQGLSICMETVKMHGGSLELVSTGQSGTSFRFTVPKENSGRDHRN